MPRELATAAPMMTEDDRAELLTLRVRCAQLERERDAWLEAFLSRQPPDDDPDEYDA